MASTARSGTQGPGRHRNPGALASAAQSGYSRPAETAGARQPGCHCALRGDAEHGFAKCGVQGAVMGRSGRSHGALPRRGGR